MSIYLGNEFIGSAYLGNTPIDSVLQYQNPTPQLITDGLVFYVDAGNPSSYSGTGTTVYGLNYVTGTPKTGSLNGDYKSLYGGTFVLSSSLQNSIVFTDSGMPAGTSPRTLGAWVYNNTAGGNPLWYGTNALNQGIGIQQIGTNGPTFRFYGYANDYDATVTNMWSRWVYMVGTFDGTDAKIYLNGSYIGTSNRSGWNTVLGGNLTLGKTLFGATSGNWVNGYLSIGQVYNRVLSDAEVLQNYNAQSSRFA